MKRILILFAFFLFPGLSRAQTVENGPYTIYTVGKGIYHIEDATSERPAGVKSGPDGKTISMNNSSDMYLVVGKDKALLIDLSNFLKYDNTAAESLRNIVYERAEGRDILITITHNHGDHTGMLPAFRDEKKVKFWLPAAEVKGMELFPSDRTIVFPENSNLDLGGGFVINTLELPGHTGHGTIFLLKTGISFSQVMLWDLEVVYGFLIMKVLLLIKKASIILYIENPVNNIKRQNLVLYGGHYWQKGRSEKLTADYIYDMRTLIKRIADGTADAKPANSGRPYLNTNFNFGTATITWNSTDAERYSKEH